MYCSIHNWTDCNIIKTNITKTKRVMFIYQEHGDWSSFLRGLSFSKKTWTESRNDFFFSNRGNWYKHGQLCGKKHLNMENLLQNLKQHSLPAIFVMTRFGTAIVVCPAHMLLSKYICGHCEAISAFRKKIFVLLDSTFLHLPPSKKFCHPHQKIFGWILAFPVLLWHMFHAGAVFTLYYVTSWRSVAGAPLLSAIFWHGSHF